MIRLDGNSLAAFRGAGVAGTVQSVAGCELFGEARLPKWASPYSAAATAYIKSHFVSEWNDIREFGFDNPEYVPLINAHPERAEFYTFYQQVEYICSNSLTKASCSYIDSQLTDSTNNYKIEVGFKYVSNGGTFPSVICAGYRSFRITPSPAYNAVRATQYSHQWTPEDVTLSKITSGNSYVAIAECSQRSISIQVDDNEPSVNSNVNTSYSGSTIYLLNCPDSPSAQDGPYINPVYYWKIWQDGVQVAEMYPCKRKSDNEAGVYDTIRGLFLTNAGGGSLVLGPEQSPA